MGQQRETFTLTDELEFTARSQGRTITEGDFSAMTNLTWTTAEYHTNKPLMLESDMGERNLAGACVIAFALGLATPAVRNRLSSIGVKLVALAGYEEVRFKSPLRPGDTIYVETQVRSIFRTSRPHIGVINFDDTVVDHDGRVLCTYVRSALCDVSESTLYSPPAPG
jgi:acyl dehydratase